MKRTNWTFEEFEQYLREALTHLYDPAYRPPDLLVITAGDRGNRVESVQAAVIEAIKDLEPGPDIPPGARVRRVYELLAYRYLQNLTQEETAQLLGISPRHLRREQQQAVEVLARRLWEQRKEEPERADDRLPEASVLPEAAGTTAESSVWHSQVKQELLSLQMSAPGLTANVREEIQAVVKLAGPLTLKHNVTLNVEPISARLTTTFHPSVLHQLLVTAIEKLVQHMSSGQITLGAERDGGQIKIAIRGEPATAENPPESDLIREIMVAQGGSIEVDLAENNIAFRLALPAADKIAVLVIDDNVDLVHFYRRYTSGTRYQIVHVGLGQQVFSAIEASPPDIIVLDVMLPDIDGWELLVQLQEQPASKTIPIIVCSVVRRDEMALALGAALYVPKPVRRRQFIQALDQVINRASIKA